MLMFSSCGGEKISFELSADEIANTVVAELNMQNMVPLNKNQIEIRYTLPNEYIDDMSIYISGYNDNADEVAIFHLSEQPKASAVMAAVEERRKEIKESFSLNPVESKKIENAVSVQINSYVVFVVGENTKDIQDILK